MALVSKLSYHFEISNLAQKGSYRGCYSKSRITEPWVVGRMSFPILGKENTVIRTTKYIETNCIGTYGKLYLDDNLIETMPSYCVEVIRVSGGYNCLIKMLY